MVALQPHIVAEFTPSTWRLMGLCAYGFLWQAENAREGISTAQISQNIQT